jgi:hypothetical protein
MACAALRTAQSSEGARESILMRRERIRKAVEGS